MLENLGFDDFFDGIGKFHPGMREKFYAVIVIRIVRSGDDHSGLEIILPDQASDAGGGDDAGEGHGGARLRETRGENGSDVRAGFAGVHADERVRGAVFAAKVCAEGAAGGVKSGVVQRRGAGYAANSVGAEKLFGHESRKVDRGADDLEGQSNTAGNLVFANVRREFLEMLLMG